jgi:hypothetical protein
MKFKDVSANGTAEFWFELPIHSIFTETLRNRYSIDIAQQ